MQKPRCLALFEEACKSEQTRKAYTYYLDSFLKWAQKDYESLLLLDSKQIESVLQDYIIYLKKKISPNSIGPIMSALEKFLVMNDKIYNKKKIALLLPELVERQGGKAWNTEQIRKMLEYADSTRAKIIIHILASTGCRPGGLVGLKIKDVVDMPEGSKGLIFYSGTKWKYIGFLHPEAAKIYEQYISERKGLGEMITSDSLVILPAKPYFTRITPTSVGSIHGVLSHIAKKAKIARIKEGKRFDTPIATGFRKRFNTILKSNPNISYAIAERLMDHRTNLEKHYLDTPMEKLFEEYKKAIPELTISPEERQKLVLAEKERKISEFEAQQTQINGLKQVAETLTEQVKRMSLKQEIQKQWQEQLFDWGSKNLTPDKFAKLTRTDLYSNNSLEDLAEHIIKEHDGKCDSSTKFTLKISKIKP